MAAAPKKKQISQEDLRKIMKQKTQSNRNKIDSPFAKYNSLDQLSCSLCCLPIKSELMWNAHILSRTHKESLLKSQINKSINKSVDSLNEVPNKKMKISGTEETSTALPFASNSNPSSTSLGTTLLNVNTPSSGSAPKSILKNKTESRSTNPSDTRTKVNNGANGCTTDDNLNAQKTFKDRKIETSANTDPDIIPDTKTELPADVAQFIPEGFFDDPKLDAKVRNIPYKDKMDEQMELFQKAIKEEAMVSESIIEEDDEERDEQRLLDEIDEQMIMWSKVEYLAKSKQPVRKVEIKKEESDDDDSDVDEFLDWRNKSFLSKLN